MRTDAMAGKQKEEMKSKDKKESAPPVADTLNATDLTSQPSTTNQNANNSIEMDSACAADASVQPISESSSNVANNEGNPENIVGEAVANDYL